MASRDEVLEHLGYEWWMFRESRELFRCADAADPATRNAYAEALTIHGRALVGFFYPPKTKRFPTDWDVGDFGMTLPAQDQKPPELEAWYEATGQHVAHLTDHRVRTLGQLPTQPVCVQLARCVERVKDHIGRNNMPADWIGDRPKTLRCADTGQESSPFGATGATQPASSSG